MYLSSLLPCAHPLRLSTLLRPKPKIEIRRPIKRIRNSHVYSTITVSTPTVHRRINCRVKSKLLRLTAIAEVHKTGQHQLNKKILTLLIHKSHQTRKTWNRLRLFTFCFPMASASHTPLFDISCFLHCILRKFLTFPI